MSAFFQSSLRSNSKSSSSRTSADKESNAGPPKKALIRRSRSVSAFPRSQTDVFPEFSIKRDNPLFCNSPPPLDDGIEGRIRVKVPNFEETASSNLAKSAKGDRGRRGRSVSRKGDVGEKVLGARKELDRSSSTAENVRRSRSVSRRPVSRANSSVFEHMGEEQESKFSTKLRNKSNLISSSMNNGALHRAKSNSSYLDQMEGQHTRTRSRHFDPPGSSPRMFDLASMKAPNWEDLASSSSSMSEPDDVTFQAASEQIESVQDYNSIGGGATGGVYGTVRSEVRRAISDIQNDLENAIQRSSATAIESSNANDTSHDFVNPGGVELASDLRREYSNRLEQSEDRARKLRAELAVEEQRRIELSQMLKEELQETKASSPRRSRTGRKSSFERRKISKALSEEAMAYFDECVSLSTFDSTDFSSFGDPPLNIVGGTTTETDSISLPYTSPRHSHLNDEQEPIHKKQNPRSVNKENARKFQFSFSSPRPNETSEFQQDIRKYVKTLDKDIRRADVGSQTRYDPDEYNFLASKDSLLFDQVFFKNRLESGSMLLCGEYGSPFLK